MGCWHGFDDLPEHDLLLGCWALRTSAPPPLQPPPPHQRGVKEGGRWRGDVARCMHCSTALHSATLCLCGRCVAAVSDCNS